MLQHSTLSFAETSHQHYDCGTAESAASTVQVWHVSGITLFASDPIIVPVQAVNIRPNLLDRSNNKFWAIARAPGAIHVA